MFQLLRYHVILVRLHNILTFFILDNVLFTSNDFVFLSNNVAIIYKRLSSQSFSYLSWLGLTAEQPPTQKILVPGFNAPAPNPQMHLIRRSDADSRRNIQEFKLLW